MRYVIALGGNALEKGSLRAAAETVELLKAKGNDVVLTHGNGPQVGELAEREPGNLALLTAETELTIGNALCKALDGDATTLLTHTVVSKSDGEFRRPTKPVGDFYSRAQSERLSRKGYAMRKLIGGYRRVVPSPRPRSIVELGAIRSLLRSGRIVVCAGGGGIAVINHSDRTEFAEAVIDKDRASALLAMELHADRLVILTRTEGAYLNYGERGQRMLGDVSASELKRYARQGHFEKGSMQPKVEACISFVERTGKPAAIGSLSHPALALSMKNCTVVRP